jgi:hypothetical protein
MDDAIRRRMKFAIEVKGLDPYKVSEDAGFNRNYLWESFDAARHKGSLGGYKKIADTIGLRYFWLIEGEGEPYSAGEANSSLDRHLVTVAFEVILERLGLDLAMARDAASKVLDILERPPNGNSAIDKSSRVRSGILGALRVYEPPSNQ